MMMGITTRLNIMGGSNLGGQSEQGERRKEVVVVDRPLEVGIKLNNILTALVLMVMSWVGFNIDTMKTDMGVIRTDVTVQANELKHIKERMDDHVTNHR